MVYSPSRMSYFSSCVAMALLLSSMVPTFGRDKNLQCPPCTCKDEKGIVTANCTGLNLTSVPENIPRRTATLLFGNNNLTDLEGISAFPKLVILNLTCNYFTTLTKSTFKHTPLIRTLDISNNGLQFIQPEVFTALKKIEVLDISDNPLLGWKGMINATQGLQDSALRTLYMNKIVRDSTVCSVVKLEICKYLKNTSLSVLHSDRNKIEQFKQTCFRELPKTLQNVSLKENKLTTGYYLRDVSSLSGLEELDISDKAGLRPLPDLTDLVTDEQELQDDETCLDKDLYEMSSYLTNGDFEESLFYDIPSNLKRFKCSYMKLSYHINGVNVSKNSLIHLDLSSNLISTWNGPVYGLEKLLHLNLMDNVARSYSLHFFETFPELRTLDLSRNFIGPLLSNDTNGITFSKLDRLESLNLSYNLISYLPERIFRGLPSLKFLDVSNNYIHGGYFCMKHMNNLRVVNVSNNRIRRLFSDTRQAIDRLKKTGSIRVNLSDNPLACICENIPFLNWLLNNGDIFGDFSHYVCIFNHADVSYINNVTAFHRVLKKLNENCSNSFVLNLALVALSLIVVFMLVSGIIYRYRWRLRYWYYSARLRKTVDRDSDAEYRCDAFVSFADEDRDFVHSHLKVILEEESGLKLIIRDRDFSPNEYEIKSIVNAVHVCRKTVLVLSDDFFKRFLCEKELEMAHYEQIETQRNIIIIVMYRRPTIKTFPPEIHYKLKSDSYIDYPKYEDKSAFWQKLLDAIKEED